MFQKTGDIPRLPKDIVKPTIVAGVNALGRGQDRESLQMFMQTIAQTMGPEAIAQYINPEEVVKRLARIKSNKRLVQTGFDTMKFEFIDSTFSV